MPHKKINSRNIKANMPHTKQTARKDTSEVIYYEVAIDWKAVILQANSKLLAKERRRLATGRIQRALTVVVYDDGEYYF